MKLAVAQLLSGASNAVSIALAASLLPDTEFRKFALAQLLLLSAVAGQRAFLLEPFLTFSDGPRALPVHWFGSVSLLVLMLLPALVFIADLPGWSGREMLGLIGVSLCPLLQDFLRFSAIGRGRLNSLILADGLWFVAATAAFMLIAPSSALEAYSLWAAAACLSFLALWSVVHGHSSGPSWRQVINRGRFQLGEFVLITSCSLLPFLAARALFPGAPIGAYRLVQSFIGPINSMATMINLTMLSRAETLQVGFRVPSAAKDVSKKVGRAITLLTVAYIIVLGFVGAVVMRYGTLQIPQSEIGVAYVALGAATIIGASVSVKASIFRLLGEQKLTLAPRAVTLMFLCVGLFLGEVVAGVSPLDPLALCFVAGAVGSNIAWRVAFNRHWAAQAPE